VRIGLFGGTLDPIHFGHLRAAEEVWEGLRLDEIWFLPAARPPHKDPLGLTPFGHRLAMIELAIGPVAHFKAVPMEADRPGPSYSVDTLEQLRQAYGQGMDFFFLLGSDAFLEIEQWRSYRRLTELVSFVIMVRSEEDRAGIADLMARAYPEHRAQGRPDVYTARGNGSILLFTVTHLAISATEIRRRAREGRSVHFLVPDPVMQYMEGQRLYSSSPKDRPLAPPAIPEDGSPPDLARLLATEIGANKGERTVILDVRGLSDFTDFFVIAQGRSTRHVNRMSDRIQDSLRQKGVRCKGTEGEREGKWVLMDYGDVVVHLFYEPVRKFYDLEGLWSQARRLELGEEDFR